MQYIVILVEYVEYEIDQSNFDVTQCWQLFCLPICKSGCRSI